MTLSMFCQQRKKSRIKSKQVYWRQKHYQTNTVQSFKVFCYHLRTEFPNFLLTHLHLRRWKFSICEAYLVWGINFSVNINYRMLLKVFCNHCYSLIRSLNFLPCSSVRNYNNKHNGFSMILSQISWITLITTKLLRNFFHVSFNKFLFTFVTGSNPPHLYLILQQL